jgi:hypothetical protein
MVRVDPAVVTRTRGWAVRLRYQAGCRSSPPNEATSTTRSSSTIGAASMVERCWPDLRPVVTSSTTGRPTIVPRSRPLEALKIARWMRVDTLWNVSLALMRVVLLLELLEIVEQEAPGVAVAAGKSRTASCVPHCPDRRSPAGGCGCGGTGGRVAAAANGCGRLGHPRRSPSPSGRLAEGVTKAKAGCWTRWRAFAQVRQGSNIKLLSVPLVVHRNDDQSSEVLVCGYGCFVRAPM